MSRGPGALQRRILQQIENAPEERLTLDEVRRRFGDTDRSNLARAIRSLRRMGELSKNEVDGVAWLALPSYNTITDEELDALLAKINRPPEGQ